MRAGIFARVSLDPDGQSRSVDEQILESKAWATREGWTVTHVIDEKGSASRFARGTRERWPEVVDLIETGAFDILITWESSRATRDLAVYAMLRDLCARRGVLWAYSGTVYDLAKREDRFRTGLDALLSEDESARISERVQRSTRARARDGAPHGKIPYGYRREYDEHRRPTQLVDEPTAQVVRRIHADVIAGKPLYAIAQALDAEGVAKPRPGKYGWQTTTVRRIVTSPTYLGKRVHRGEVVGDAAWPAIVDQATFDAANAALRSPDRPRRPDTSVHHLLSGIATCGVCGSPMYVLKPRGYLSYACGTGHHVARSKELLEPFVVDRLLWLLEQRADVTAPLDDDAGDSEAVAELEQLRIRLATFQDAAAAGELTAGSLVRVEGRLLPAIAAAERKIRAVRAPSVLAGIDMSTPTASWPDWPLETQRTVLRESVDVVVNRVAVRGRRGAIDPDAVTITPRW
ncbi:recombinase family protein [Angustibacter sp. McL0619]|uniref:recombinase family protein n=1 Tax=Angustibacter sp. McL0619 TaxID=3415676 RepID=UPI003CF38CC7